MQVWQESHTKQIPHKSTRKRKWKRVKLAGGRGLTATCHSAWPTRALTRLCKKKNVLGMLAWKCFQIKKKDFTWQLGWRIRSTDSLWLACGVYQLLAQGSFWILILGRVESSRTLNPRWREQVEGQEHQSRCGANWEPRWCPQTPGHTEACIRYFLGGEIAGGFASNP